MTSTAQAAANPGPPIESPPLIAPTAPQPTADPPPVVTPAPAVVATPVVDAVELEDDERAMHVTTNGDQVMVPSSAFRKLKDNAAAKARAKALAEIDEHAKALGLSDAAALIAAIQNKEITMTTPANPAPAPTPAPAPAPAAPAAAAPAPAAPTPAPTPAPAVAPVVTPPSSEVPPEERGLSDATRTRLRKQREEAARQVAEAQGQAKTHETALKAMQAQVATMQAEQGMRDEMIRSGCIELDYTFTKLREHIKTLTDDTTPEGKEKLKAFDVKAWITERKTAQPFLFGATAAPATTGVPPTTAPVVNPSDAAAAAGAASKKDAMSMTQAEWAAYKKANNLS